MLLRVVSSIGALAAVLVGLRESRRARRIDAMQCLFDGLARRETDVAESRNHRWAQWMLTLSERRIERAPEPRSAHGGILALVGVARSMDAHRRLLAWALDRDGAHGLGSAFARDVLAAVGLDPEFAARGYRVRLGTTAVFLERRGATLAVAIDAVGERARASGAVAWLSVEALSEAVGMASVRASGAARGVFVEWAQAIDEVLRGRGSMSEWKGFSPDVRFLLEHWQEYLDVMAVREELDREFVAQRQRVVARVRERYTEVDGWDVTLDEDWVLLRRKSWPVPGEEWLAFVVVLTDVESVMVEGRDGFWSALSMPTDGDFDGETFTTLVRARLDPAVWRPWLGKPWPGYALARHLPRLDGTLLQDGELERHCLDEFARYVELVPWVEQALRDMG